MPAVLSDPIRYAPVTRPYRRWLAASAALLLHLVLFAAAARLPFAPTPAESVSLDVVLVTRPSEAPVDAEAIAEAAQRAAGTPTEAAPAAARAAPSAPSRREAAAAEPAAARSETEPVAEASEPPREADAGVDSPASAPPVTGQSAASVPDAPATSGRDLLAQATASIREQGLAPERAGPREEEARSAARQAAEARYIDDWTRRVEDYGNRVHPAPRHLHGQLRIRVVIGRDGELRRAEVIQSSGHPELDQAALDTVHGAAPYRPFDRGMGDRESLSITRVWRFGQGNHFGVRQGS
ncbi:TonB family protein [Billgrantia azerbaijanica]|nr:TonB family protein [Halomonas azerbaijanica]